MKHINRIPTNHRVILISAGTANSNGSHVFLFDSTVIKGKVEITMASSFKVITDSYLIFSIVGFND